MVEFLFLRKYFKNSWNIINKTASKIKEKK